MVGGGQEVEYLLLGEEVCVAQRLTCPHVEASLPASGIASSIRPTDVSVGAVLVAARDSSVVRLNDHEVDEAVSDGKLHVEPGELEKLIRMMAARGLVEPIEKPAV